MTDVLKPQLGDFFTTKTTGKWYNRAFAWLIRWFTARKVPCQRSWRTLWRSHTWEYAKVNHAGVYVGSDSIVEAVSKVKVSSVYDYPDAYWSRIELTDLQRRQIARFAYDQVGKKYNWAGLFAVAVVQERFGGHVKEWANDWAVKKLSDGERWYCSQVVDAAFEAADVHLFQDERPTGLVSPQDEYDLPGGH